MILDTLADKNENDLTPSINFEINSLKLEYCIIQDDLNVIFKIYKYLDKTFPNQKFASKAVLQSSKLYLQTNKLQGNYFSIR